MNEKLTNSLKSIGPGILFAGAAIGGSHLIQSTRAGASFGFELLYIVILVNLLKYPFFEYGHRYAAATGETLIDGYKKLGRWAVWTFFIMSVFLGIVNTAAVTIVTAGLFGHFLKFSTGIMHSAEFLAGVLLAITVMILFVGKYSLLDKIIKVLITVLSIFTVVAFFMAFAKGSNAAPGFTSPEIYNDVGIAFLIALMGWMPAPIELSVWSSIWSKERRKQTKHTATLKESLLDFHIGYITTATLAVFFLGLGAFVMYGTGLEFSNSGVAFSAQLVELYKTTLGDFMEPIIASIALITMISTMLTVVDAYPRSLEESVKAITNKENSGSSTLYIIFVVIMVVSAFLIVSLMMKRMTTLIDIATILSFLAAPVFAAMNFKLVMSNNLPESARPPKWMRILSRIGLVFFTGFGIIYIFTRIF